MVVRNRAFSWPAPVRRSAAGQRSCDRRIAICSTFARRVPERGERLLPCAPTAPVFSVGPAGRLESLLSADGPNFRSPILPDLEPGELDPHHECRSPWPGSPAEGARGAERPRWTWERFAFSRVRNAEAPSPTARPATVTPFRAPFGDDEERALDRRVSALSARPERLRENVACPASAPARGENDFVG